MKGGSANDSVSLLSTDAPPSSGDHKALPSLLVNETRASSQLNSTFLLIVEASRYVSTFFIKDMLVLPVTVKVLSMVLQMWLWMVLSLLDANTFKDKVWNEPHSLVSKEVLSHP